MDDADAARAAESQVRNPFPTPPAYWIRYTPENIRLLGLLKDKISQGDGWIRTRDEEEPVDQETLLPDEALLPSFPLLELEPPRLDWILEEEAYESFGVVHQTNETARAFPGDVKRVFNLEPGSDPRPHLRQLLVSLLHAYHKLLSEVIEPVPPGYHKTITPNHYPMRNWQATADWMQTLVTNFGWLVNEFRPIQARMTLESMMQRQIDIRREETKVIHGKCDELERTLADLRSKTSALLPPSILASAPVPEGSTEADPTPVTGMELSSRTSIPILTTEDLIAWSQEAIP